MRSVLLWLFLAFAAPCLLAQRMPETSHAQQAQFSFATDREDLISLKGKWRFQPGDNPAYASPTFDDSHWALLDSDRPWSEQGYKGMSGLAWYRFRVTLPAGTEPMALYLPTVRTCYQVFADGVLLTTVGRMPPNPVTYRTRPAIVLLPNRPRVQPQTTFIALRIWQNPIWAAYNGGGPVGGSALGSVAQIAPLDRSRIAERAWESSMSLDLAALEFLAMIVAFALYLVRRSEREYLWFGLVTLSFGVFLLVQFYQDNHTHPLHLMDGINGAVGECYKIALLFFYCSLLKGRKNLLFWCAIAGSVIDFASMWSMFTGHLKVAQSDIIGLLVDLPYFTWVLLLMAKRLRERLPDARLLILPLLLLIVAEVLNVADGVLVSLSLGHLPSFDLMEKPVEITTFHLVEVLFLLAMLAILIARFARTSREQDRTASEFEAARSLQHVLIPEELPTIHGLSIATAYHPAQEVGGDFFQVIPLPGGETLIVIGDVSGKGLKAAMNVSVIVGALRTLAEITTSPALILAGLNRRLQSRDAGFTTCIVLRFAADNTLTLSNAGHLAPYVNGRELETEANLPLGLLESCCYQEQSIPLNPGDHLTMLTDGIPEATRRIAKKDELFGFTRTQEIAHQTAASIAKAALTFGQTDDITVLTIDLLPSV